MREGSSSSVRVFYPKLNREKVVEILEERIGKLEKLLPLVRVVLFGSYAKGTYTVGSDLDLLVVYAGRPREDAYAVAKKALGLPRLEVHPFTNEEYEAMRETIDRMTGDGVILYLKPGNEGRGDAVGSTTER